MVPAILDNITGQQIAHFIHGAMAMVMIAVILGHIYIGTIGTEGAFEAMSTGRVDFNYAREHHSVWVQEQVARRGARGAAGYAGGCTGGRGRLSRTGQPAGFSPRRGCAQGRNSPWPPNPDVGRHLRPKGLIRRKPVRFSSSGASPAARDSMAARTSSSRLPKARAT